MINHTHKIYNLLKTRHEENRKRKLMCCKWCASQLRNYRKARSFWTHHKMKDIKNFAFNGAKMMQGTMDDGLIQRHRCADSSIKNCVLIEDGNK